MPIRPQSLPAHTLGRIVEFATEDEAKKAKVELADKAFMGRSVFIREVS